MSSQEGGLSLEEEERSSLSSLYCQEEGERDSTTVMYKMRAHEAISFDGPSMRGSGSGCYGTHAL